MSQPQLSKERYDEVRAVAQQIHRTAAWSVVCFAGGETWTYLWTNDDKGDPIIELTGTDGTKKVFSDAWFTTQKHFEIPRMPPRANRPHADGTYAAYAYVEGPTGIPAGVVEFDRNFADAINRASALLYKKLFAMEVNREA